METRHDLEMNGNRGRRLVKAETDCDSGTQSEPLNTRATEHRKAATRRSWVRSLITSLYPLILTGSVSHSSNPLDRFRVRVGTGTEPL